MSDETKKQIAGLIGHHQLLEKRVTALTEEFETKTAQLSNQVERLSEVIRQLDNVSDRMTETVRKSVHAGLNMIERDLIKVGVEHQKPAIKSLDNTAIRANDAVYAIERNMSRYTWISALYTALTVFIVMGGCLWGVNYFFENGYERIAAMQRMEAVWQRKAPLADISTCDGKPCVKVDTSQSFGDKKNTYL
ncbi:tRNA modification GTPase [Providencia stuartii]|uniref:tRNA modification GTPase n=1 Tax=Providencia stuartii TaxID=588 RepID=UPI0024AA2244|nr:tRNA modification GTPase [Providencia stuartii]MCX3072503.1 tRNA modification GTPase [Providencia stuartii]